jgi:hypothetical protein
MLVFRKADLPFMLDCFGGLTFQLVLAFRIYLTNLVILLSCSLMQGLLPLLTQK